MYAVKCLAVTAIVLLASVTIPRAEAPAKAAPKWALPPFYRFLDLTQKQRTQIATINAEYCPKLEVAARDMQRAATAYLDTHAKRNGKLFAVLTIAQKLDLGRLQMDGADRSQSFDARSVLRRIERKKFVPELRAAGSP